MEKSAGEKINEVSMGAVMGSVEVEELQYARAMKKSNHPQNFLFHIYYKITV